MTDLQKTAPVAQDTTASAPYAKVGYADALVAAGIGETTGVGNVTGAHIMSYDSRGTDTLDLHVLELRTDTGTVKLPLEVRDNTPVKVGNTPLTSEQRQIGHDIVVDSSRHYRLLTTEPSLVEKAVVAVNNLVIRTFPGLA